MLVAVALLAGLLLRKPVRLRMDRRGLAFSSVAGLANAIGMVAFFFSLKRLDASLAAMVIALSPIVVLSMLALRGERVTHRHAVRVLLALAGVYLLIGPGGHADRVGVVLVVGAVLAFSSQLAVMQWYLKGYDTQAVTFYLTITMTAAITLFWLGIGTPWQRPDTVAWVAIIVLAIVSTVVARILLFGAVNVVGGGQMAMLAPLETLLAVSWSILFLGERLSPLQFVGGLLIITSALLAIQRLNVRRRRAAVA
jgi:drug/metabolite transporter (DMT)-like permease